MGIGLWYSPIRRLAMQLSIQHISKTYPNGVKALEDFSLEIGAGMFGLLGPNGAGKSTLMRTIATLQKADMGQIHFNGIDTFSRPMALRKKLGYLPQEFGVYPRVTAEKLLDYLARLKGIATAKDRRMLIGKCLEITNLTKVAKQYVSGYSGGMKQRFGIAQLLLNQPELIIVDEPTAGLDPSERRRFLNILREVGTENIVIFSTHIVEDIKDLCTDMAVVNKGRLLQHDSPEIAIEKLHGKVWKRQASKTELAAIQADHQVLSATYNRDNSLRVRVLANERPGPKYQVAAPHLEDAYFAALAKTA